MATETQQTCAYVHHMRHPTQHVLRVFFEDFLDHDAPSFGAHLEVLRHKLWQLKLLQIHVYDYRMILTWWAPQGVYRPRHLKDHEAHELVVKSVTEVLASLCGWPVPPHIVSVGDLIELHDIKCGKDVDWGLGGKTV